MRQPHPAHDLRCTGPIGRWDEALPLGNGLLGALVWGDGQPLRLSLDRADLWDLRPVPEWESPDYGYATMRRWVAENRMADLHRLYAEPYEKYPGPTRIPAGRLELPTGAVAGSRLRLDDATAEVALEGGRRLEVFIPAQQPVGCLRLLGAGPSGAAAVPPAYAGEGPPGVLPLSALGYPPAQPRADARAAGFVQRGWGGFAYALAVASAQRGPGRWDAAWSIATTGEGDPWEIAASRAAAALAAGWEALHRTHADWWAGHWARSALRLDSPRLERQWYLETHKFGAAARRGAPPITLQAVWTADEGGIPPWKGDYHHDLNTQLSYWPCYSGNRLEDGLGYLDWLWSTRAEARAYTRGFWGLPGLNVPMTADLLGRQMGGWEQYCFSATTGAWLAHHFYLHWRYSRDRAFLRERAYPYLEEVCTFLEAVAEPGPDGRRHLPLSASPEIHDNRREAWFPATTNYDLALLRWAFGAAAELAGELDRPGPAARWRAALEACPQLARASDGRLLVAPGIALHESHRHFSHLMAIHPLGLVQDRGTANAALAELERLGSGWWCGYSFAWLASLAARAGDGARAERALDVFARAFCSPNGFHLNGDQSGEGHSRLTYRPFTLEGNFAAAAGIQEMLLQSHGGVVRVFPAVPAGWIGAEFETLRAEGAFLVSARREGGRTAEVAVRAEAGGRLVLEDPFPGARAEVRGLPAGTAPARDAAGRITADLPPGAEVVWRRG